MNNLFQRININEITSLLGFTKKDKVQCTKNKQFLIIDPHKNAYALGYVSGYNIHKLRKYGYKVTIKKIYCGLFLVMIEREVN